MLKSMAFDIDDNLYITLYGQFEFAQGEFTNAFKRFPDGVLNHLVCLMNQME